MRKEVRKKEAIIPTRCKMPNGSISEIKNRRIVLNRIFLAYQWGGYRDAYEQVCKNLHKVYPVYFYAVGRPAGQPAENLFEKIKSVLLTSSAAIFDASKGNANVSLEYGLAHFVPGLEHHLLIDQHVIPNSSTIGTPIISDLAGATQNRWSIASIATLTRHLEAIAERHPYSIRFRRYCKEQRLRGGQFRRPLKLIRLFDEKDRILRRELIDTLMEQIPSLNELEAKRMLQSMKEAGLVKVSAGREWASSVSIT